MTRTVIVRLAPIAMLGLFTSLVSLRGFGAQDARPGEHPRFRIGVDAVRIDAVVTDRQGRIVDDLTADDFEIFQNGKRQTVTFAQLVRVAAGPATTERASAAAGPVAGARLPAPAPGPTRENIQRTLAVVIDDLGLSVESLLTVKRALHTFVDRDLLSTDLVGILRTGGSAGALQPFTTDRRLLHATIDALRWNGRSRSGVEPFEAVEAWTMFDDRHGLGDINDFKKVTAIRSSMSASGTLGALNLAIQGARDLPGRKTVLFVSEGISLLDEEGLIDTRVRTALDRVTDQATRAGVVIYSLDARGLQTGGLQASDNLKRPATGQTMDQTVRGEAAGRVSFNQRTQDTLVYLAEQTGGFAVVNTNSLDGGLGRISADIRDYYVIGYVPDKATFVGEGRKPARHKISVKVRRPGLRVRTRKEFIGVSDVDRRPAPTTPAQELIRGAISPFVATDIPLRVTTAPGFLPGRGLLVRTQLHIDARGLTFIDGEDGKKTASADVLGMAFDGDGTEVAHLSTGFSVGLNEHATSEALRDGLLYTFRVPVPRAGAYQLRFAVRDRETGKLGTAGEFVELDDVERGVFGLSGIIMGSSDAAALSSHDGAIISASEALREYRAGSQVPYSFEIYNAGDRVMISTSLWRGAQKLATVPPTALTRPRTERHFTTSGQLKLGESLPPGGYTLQISAASEDSAAKRQARTASRRIDFEVR
jgi:VWFA-related protein